MKDASGGRYRAFRRLMTPRPRRAAASTVSEVGSGTGVETIGPFTSVNVAVTV